MKLQQFLKLTCNRTTYDVCWKIDRSLLENGQDTKLTFKDCHQESSMGWMHSNQLDVMHPGPKNFWKPGTPVPARYFHHATFAVRPWLVKVGFLKSFHAVWRSFLWLAPSVGAEVDLTPRNFKFLNLLAQRGLYTAQSLRHTTSNHYRMLQNASAQAKWAMQPLNTSLPYFCLYIITLHFKHRRTSAVALRAYLRTIVIWSYCEHNRIQ